MLYITTTKLAQKFGIDKRVLFDKLNELGWIERKNDKWVLTDQGRLRGGQVRTSPETGDFVVWPQDLVINFEMPSRNNHEMLPAIDYHVASEGEGYISEYFDAIGIEYIEQHTIVGLQDSYASYRVADYFLPRYKVVVEFAGRWNHSEEERKRYANKKNVYIMNKIPCVWLYPDNLGVLHYIFHKRLEAVLDEYKFEKELRIYRFKQFWKKDSDNVGGLVLGLVTLIYIANPWNKNEGWAWFGAGVIVYNLYRILSDINRIRVGKSIELSRLTRWGG